MRRSSVLLLLLLVLTSCRRVTPLPESALRDLTSLDEFRAAFNSRADTPRLLILLSPT
jgi:hypothetical protein